MADTRNPGTATPSTNGMPPGYHLRPEWEVSPRDVRRMLDAKDDVTLLDCRTPQEHRIARIEGAKLVPLSELGAQLDALDDMRDRRVVVYCHHGVRSLQMTMLLRQQGFRDVKSMAGGIELWSLDIDPSVPRY